MKQWRQNQFKICLTNAHFETYIKSTDEAIWLPFFHEGIGSLV